MRSVCYVEVVMRILSIHCQSEFYPAPRVFQFCACAGSLLLESLQMEVLLVLVCSERGLVSVRTNVGALVARTIAGQ